MVPELIPILGSKPAGDVSHKPGGRLLLLFAHHCCLVYIRLIINFRSVTEACRALMRWLWHVSQPQFTGAQSIGKSNNNGHYITIYYLPSSHTIDTTVTERDLKGTIEFN